MAADRPARGDAAPLTGDDARQARARQERLERRARRQVEHVRSLFVQTPAALAGNGIGLLLMATIFQPLADGRAVLGWVAAMAVLWLVRLLHYLRFRARPDAGAATLNRWRVSWRALVLLQGAVWGIAVWLFWGLGDTYHRMALIVIVYSYCLGSVQLLATQPRVFLGFIALVLAPTVVRVATDPSQAWHWQFAGILSLLFGLTFLLGRTAGTALAQAIKLKSRTDELAAQLTVEKQEAEAARRTAEAASLAKTQFFAAASHDLRQPLHAMGLFAEALRQRSHDPEVAGLVNSINESVDALEGLFNELLDITRIDSGGVDVQPAPVAMRELFARLRLHFEPTAFEKGLMLSFHGERHVAQADPVLVERILRNLVSNAIRYTEDGGVLVSCRPRSRPEGNKLLLQVWDSGIGISEHSLPRIFDEFYQVRSQRPLEPHQRKGLGLGLAIVQRLAALMGSPIEVRSRVGHGTVFSFELPAGRLPRSGDLPPGAARPPFDLTLGGRRFLLVEDEPAVREGLEVLLRAWGASVLSFDTLAATNAWLAGAEAESAGPPDLLLLDYRLPEAATGLEALTAIRARWPSARLPAILITGSTMAGEALDAERHDFHTLLKPVLPARLRATIAFKLGLR